MKTVPYTDTNGRSGFLNPLHVTHFYVSGADEITVHFARGGPIAITGYSPGTFREAIED